MYCLGGMEKSRWQAYSFIRLGDGWVEGCCGVRSSGPEYASQWSTSGEPYPWLHRSWSLSQEDG